MTAWLKLETPATGPGDARHVDFEEIMSALERSRAIGVETPAMAYLFLLAPTQESDQWGIAVPLSDLDQFNLDRTVAILTAPYERARALLHAGQLAPDEVTAIEAVFPDIYAVLVTQATDDMLANAPPYPDWAEEVLGILFQKPASAAYNAAKGIPMNPKGQLDNTDIPTVAERRETAVREVR